MKGKSGSRGTLTRENKKMYQYRPMLIFTQAQKIPESQITERCHAPPWLATLLLWQPKQGLDQGKFRGNHSDCSADLNDIAALPQIDAALGSEGFGR